MERATGQAVRDLREGLDGLSPRAAAPGDEGPGHRRAPGAQGEEHPARGGQEGPGNLLRRLRRGGQSGGPSLGPPRGAVPRARPLRRRRRGVREGARPGGQRLRDHLQQVRARSDGGEAAGRGGEGSPGLARDPPWLRLDAGPPRTHLPEPRAVGRGPDGVPGRSGAGPLRPRDSPGAAQVRPVARRQPAARARPERVGHPHRRPGRPAPGAAGAAARPPVQSVRRRAPARPGRASRPPRPAAKKPVKTSEPTASERL